MGKDESIEPWAMFNVKIKNDKDQAMDRKASDNLELLQWMEMREATSSIMKIDPDRSKNMSVSEIQARTYQQTWLTMKILLQDSLGINDKYPDPEPGQIAEEDEDDESEPEPQVAQQPQQPQQPQPREVEKPQIVTPVGEPELANADFFESEAKTVSSDDKIVL